MSTFEGANTSYEFEDIPINFRGSGGSLGGLPARGAVFMYSRGNGRQFRPVYIGQADNLSIEMTSSHSQIDCLKSEQANYLHYLFTDDRDRRIHMARDLVEHYAPACNRAI